MKNKVKPYVIKPCPEHGFKSGYVFCGWCNEIRENVVKLLGLKIW